MPQISKKLKYQILVFVITYLQVGLNSGYKAVIASCKSYQELDRPLLMDNNFFGYADFIFMLGLTIGAFVLGRYGDIIDLRLYLLLYSIAQAVSFILLGYTADVPFLNVIFKKKVQYFHQYLYTLFFTNGMFFAMCLPACTSIISNWIDIHYRGQIIAIWCSCINTGGIAFFQICFYMTTIKKYNWRYCYYLHSILLIILGIITYFFLTPYPEELNIVIDGAENTDEYQATNNKLLDTDQHEINQSQNMDELTKYQMFFKIQIVIIMVVTYSIQFMAINIIDFWLNKYLKIQGFFHSAHIISQVYELSSLFGGIFVGVVTDGIFKHYKFFLVCFFQIFCGFCFVYLNYYFTRQEYFIFMFAIGFLLGGTFNYLTGVGGKILLEQTQVKKSGLQLTTIFSILETGGSLLSIIVFLLVPIIIEQLLLVLGILLILSGILCMPELMVEYQDYKFRKQQMEDFKLLGGYQDENSNLVSDNDRSQTQK